MIAGTRRNIGATLAAGLAIAGAVALTSTSASGEDFPFPEATDPIYVPFGTLTIELGDRTGQLQFDPAGDGSNVTQPLLNEQPCNQVTLGANSDGSGNDLLALTPLIGGVERSARRFGPAARRVPRHPDCWRELRPTGRGHRARRAARDLAGLVLRHDGLRALVQCGRRQEVQQRWKPDGRIRRRRSDPAEAGRHRRQHRLHRRHRHSGRHVHVGNVRLGLEPRQPRPVDRRCHVRTGDAFRRVRGRRRLRREGDRGRTPHHRRLRSGSQRCGRADSKRAAPCAARSA